MKQSTVFISPGVVPESDGCEQVQPTEQVFEIGAQAAPVHMNVQEPVQEPPPLDSSQHGAQLKTMEPPTVTTPPRL